MIVYSSKIIIDYNIIISIQHTKLLYYTTKWIGNYYILCGLVSKYLYILQVYI